MCRHNHPTQDFMHRRFAELRCRSPIAVLSVLGLFCVLVVNSGPTKAGVVVLGNRTDKPVAFSIVRADNTVSVHRVARGDVFPIPVAEKVGVAFDTVSGPRRLLLDTNTIYYFVEKNKNLNLVKTIFPKVATRVGPSNVEEEPRCLDSVGKIPVMILVDDEEPAVRGLWEKRLRDRIEAVSDIFERHCRIRFEVVAVGTWDSEDYVIDFGKSLSEFEFEVTPAPAKVAIGFTSQYQLPRGKAHLGGTRGALHSHILIREWSQHITKTERMEVLLHELGHYLGATHSVEALSVMRPQLGGRISNARSFRIGFDPPNTLIMNTVCEAIRTRNVSSLSQLHPAAKARLHAIYSALGKTMPKDPAAESFIRRLYSRSFGKRAESQPKSLVEATQQVVRAIADAAAERADGETPSYEGDALTAFYVRRAAAAAESFPDEWAAKAFLLGLGVGLDDSRLLSSSPISRYFCARVESYRDRVRRLNTLGKPTVHGRKDLRQHFVVSCALASLIGRTGAETAGVVKEMRDAQAGGAFSFSDLSADLAGTTFAEFVMDEKISLTKVAKSFSVEAYLPEYGDDLRDEITWKEFQQHYVSPHDDRFLRAQQAIRQRILVLPGYRTSLEANETRLRRPVNIR